MLILGLGYITVKSDKLEDWTEFSRDYLGMQLVDKTKSFKWEKGEWENEESSLKI